MGEKGIGGPVSATATGAGSLVERTTTSVVTSVTGVGQDLVSTVQDRAIGAIADEAVAAARERLTDADPDVVEPPEETSIDESDPETSPS